MPKYDQVAEQLKHRILQGDYALRGLPAERQLAAECGVAHMTARRAVQQLIEEGFLVRRPNGRIDVKCDDEKHNLNPQFAFLAAAFHSRPTEGWHNSISRVAEENSAVLRHVIYRHWDDPVIGDALESFDGAFLLPSSEPMPPALLRRLTQAKKPLVILEEDLSGLGIPSVRQSSPSVVQCVLDHLEEQGHRRIDCLNVQPHHSVVEQRIAQWQVWMAAHHLEGSLHDEPVQPFGDPWAQAYITMRRVLAEGEFNAEALLCITMAAAIGGMRAMHEVGLRAGTDVAVAVIGGEGVAAYQVPSITAIEAQDLTPFIRLCMDWMLKGGGAWRGPLLMQPAVPNLVIRESTSTPRSEMRSRTVEPYLSLVSNGNHNGFNGI